ncbi:MAG: GNAT family N-acetyltransferase [Blautia sp.]|nr:GNAT family N-acetyltransferase [Blautia sp.]
MNIHIRTAGQDEYETAEMIMKQVQKMHVEWRPDIYRYGETVLPLEMYEQAVKDGTFFIAEYGGDAAGILSIQYRHVESPCHVTRNIIFIDSMAVEERYRGKGIGHAFFDFLKGLRDQGGYDGIELQVNAGNEAAYKMYSDYGFTDKSVNMELL